MDGRARARDARGRRSRRRRLGARAASRSSAPRAPGRSSTDGGHVLPDDVDTLFLPVLGHRLLLSASFLAETRGLGRDAALGVDQGSLPRAGAGSRARLGQRVGAADRRLTTCRPASGRRSRSCRDAGASSGCRSASCRAVAAAPGGDVIGTRPVRSRRSGLDDRLVRDRTTLRRVRTRRVRRARPLRRRGAARRARLRPASGDGRLPAVAAVALEAARGRRGGDGDRRERRRSAKRRRLARPRRRRGAVLASARPPRPRLARRSSGSADETPFDAPEDNVEQALDLPRRNPERSPARHASCSCSRTSSSRRRPRVWVEAARTRLGRRAGRHPGSGLGAELPARRRRRRADRRIREAVACQARAPDAHARLRAAASANEERLRRLLAELAALGLDPVSSARATPMQIDRAFIAWAELRKQTAVGTLTRIAVHRRDRARGRRRVVLLLGRAAPRLGRRAAAPADGARVVRPARGAVRRPRRRAGRRARRSRRARHGPAAASTQDIAPLTPLGARSRHDARIAAGWLVVTYELAAVCIVEQLHRDGRRAQALRLPPARSTRRAAAAGSHEQPQPGRCSRSGVASTPADLERVATAVPRRHVDARP